MSVSSGLILPPEFNNPKQIEKNLAWLKTNMGADFQKIVSLPWQNVIANQMMLLEAHEGLDHLMSRNEGCLITTDKEFSDVLLCKIFDQFFIESLHRFHSTENFNQDGPLTVVFLKLTSILPTKTLEDPEDTLAISSGCKEFAIGFSTLCPHSILYRLFRLTQALGSRIQTLNCHLSQYAEGYYIQLNFSLEKALDENLFNQSVHYLKTAPFTSKLDEAFKPDELLILDALCVIVHQILCQINPDRYSLRNIEEALLRHPELIQTLIKNFFASFDPKGKKEKITAEDLAKKIKSIDTGNPAEDLKKQTILSLLNSLLQNLLKTNFFSPIKRGLCFRFDPAFLKTIPELSEKFPEIPFGIFFMKGEISFGFHIRFKDLSRGGLRTVLSRTKEQAQTDRLGAFTEGYNLSYTQQKKNKDIPEGGAKGIIFVDLHTHFEKEMSKALHKKENFFPDYRTFTQLLSQKSYILSFLDVINSDTSGKLRNPLILDYLKRAEHIFLGPDENMSDPMIEWIAATSLKLAYSTKTAFISSKPKAGINHKTYGVTSYGVNAYMEQALHYLKIDPKKQTFTVKISGGPDGDVAGNQMMNLKKFYPKTAKLIAITDVSGTLFDPEGVDLDILEQLFHEVKPLRFYPHEKLHEGAFLLDLATRKKITDLAEGTLLIKKLGGKLVETWLSGSEMNQLFRQNLHQVKADIFIPAGGRPRTLNDYNVQEFLDKDLKPTAKAIIEGANLYLTPKARHFLEEKGVIIFKDSSANKGGVICSSYEVIAGLCLEDKQFISIKETLVTEILALIKEKSELEAKLLLDSLNQKLGFLTDLSDEVSEKINTYKYELLAALDLHPLTDSPNDSLNKIILNYVPSIVRKQTDPAHILKSLSDIHKKAIIACHLGAMVVYKKGLKWNPGIAELLPLLLNEDGIHL